MKICKICKKEQSLKNFYKSGKYFKSYCNNCYKKRYINNKQHYLNIHKIYRRKNKEKIKKYRDIKNKTIEAKYCKYRYAAKKDGRIFQLTLKQFKKLFLLNCHYCNISNRGGIDRKNNNVGYIKSNCLPCCPKCNISKHTKTYKEFLKKITQKANQNICQKMR